MWGNVKGWSISAVIAVGMLVLMWWLESLGTHATMTAKFAADPKNLAVMELAPAPETIVTTMTDACDAADKYGDALALLEKNPDLYNDKGFDPKKVEEMEAIEKVIEGQNCKDLTLITKSAAEVINFNYTEKPLIEKLRKLGMAAVNRALVFKAKKDPENARKYAEAAFALGAKMYKERVVYDEMSAGLGIMTSAATILGGLAQDAGDQARMTQIKEFALACVKFSDNSSRVHDLNFITRTIDPEVSGNRAGDVFALAELSKERMWRVEACLQLARIHRNIGGAGHASDQRYAQAVLERLAKNELDPIVKLAATKARDITDQEYNRQ